MSIQNKLPISRECFQFLSPISCRCKFRVSTYALETFVRGASVEGDSHASRIESNQSVLFLVRVNKDAVDAVFPRKKIYSFSINMVKPYYRERFMVSIPRISTNVEHLCMMNPSKKIYAQ